MLFKGISYMIYALQKAPHPLALSLLNRMRIFVLVYFLNNSLNQHKWTQWSKVYWVQFNRLLIVHLHKASSKHLNHSTDMFCLFNTQYSFRIGTAYFHYLPVYHVQKVLWLKWLRRIYSFQRIHNKKTYFTVCT